MNRYAGRQKKLTPTELRECALCERKTFWKALNVKGTETFEDKAKAISGKIGHEVVLKTGQSVRMAEFLADNDIDIDNYICTIAKKIFDEEWRFAFGELKLLETVSNGSIDTGYIKGRLEKNIEDYCKFAVSDIKADAKNSKIPHYTIQRIEPFENTAKYSGGLYVLRGIPDLVHIIFNKAYIEEVKFKLEPSKIPDEAYESDVAQLGGEALVLNFWKNMAYFKEITGSGAYLDFKLPHIVSYNGRKRYVDILKAMEKAQFFAERCLDIRENDIKNVSSLKRAEKYICSNCIYRQISIDGTLCQDHYI